MMNGLFLTWPKYNFVLLILYLLTGLPLTALFLEAPFTNIIEAATVHPFSQV
jgi:hypothetical protein